MENFEKEITKNENEISLHDMDRAARYAKDLISGLAKVKNFPQGVTIFGSARFAEGTKFYKMARELGQKLAKNHHPVITGGGPGIMEAANRGAFEAGGRSVGFNIKLATEQDLNEWTTDDMEFHYFFSRKLMMTLASRVYVFFPGGFGTMDEFSEILELKHTGKSADTPIFLVGKDFWKGLDEWFAGPMSKMNLIETGKKGELREIDFRENPASEFMENFAKNSDENSRKFAENREENAEKISRKLAADEKLGNTKSARELYKITDDIDEIVAAANAVETPEISRRVEEMMRADVENYRRKKAGK